MSNGAMGPFAALRGHDYINLITFRRNGTPVSTPVWFAAEGETLYITTYDGTGKVKRLRANGEAAIVPANARGKVLGAAQEVRGRVVTDPAEAARAEAALLRTYGWQYRGVRLLTFLENLRKTGGSGRIYLALSPL